MQRILIVAILLANFNLLIAQNKTKSDYSFKERNFFQEMRVSWIMGVGPSFNVQIKDNNGEILDEFRVASQIVSLLGFGYDPRVNLLNLSDKASISLSVPMDLSLGLSITTPDDGVNTGFFAGALGFFVDANVGNHSTFNNIDRKGYAVGIGYRLYKAPLIGISDGMYKFPRIATGVSLRFKYKNDFRNGVNKLYYIETGIPQQFEYKYGIKKYANLFVNAGIGWTLNY